MQNNKAIATPTKIEFELNLLSKLIIECFAVKSFNKQDTVIIHNADIPKEDFEYLESHDYLFADTYNCCNVEMLEMYLNLFGCICKDNIVNIKKVLRMLCDINMSEASYMRVPFKIMRRMLKINDGVCVARYQYVFKEHKTTVGNINEWLSTMVVLAISHKKVAAYIKLLLNSPPQHKLSVEGMIRESREVI